MKLTYFDFNGGRGEDCRLALHIAGVEFEDERIKGPEWQERKPKTPYGALPVLTTEHGELAHSNAILRYIGREFGLHPTDPWQAAQHEALMHALEEARHALAEKTDSSTPEAKQASREAFLTNYLLPLCRNIEAQITGPFIGGDGVQVADLKLAVWMNAYKAGTIDHIPATLFADFPKIEGVWDAVYDNARVREWNARHQ